MRESFKLKLLRTITIASEFSEHDFTIADGGRYKDGREHVVIAYRRHEAFHFAFVIPTEPKRVNLGARRAEVWEFPVEAAPGRVALNEEFVARGEDELFQAVLEWLRRIREDEEAASVLLPIVEFDREFSDWVDRISANAPEEPFTPNEIEDIRDRLEQLRRELTERVRQTESNQQRVAERLEEIERSIEVLREKSKGATKRRWMTTLALEALKWGLKPENRQLVIHQLHEFSEKLLSD